MPKPKKLSLRGYVTATVRVASLSFRIAPGPIIFKLSGILVTALLPVGVTFFAAKTATELAAAYAGTPGAGQQAVTYIGLTALFGLLTTFWNSIDQYIQQVIRYKVESVVSDKLYEHFLALDFWQYDDKDTADLYDRAKKFSQFFAYVFDRGSRLLTQFVTLIVALVALALVLPWIAVAVLVAVAPSMYVQLKLSRRQVAHWNTTVEARRSRSYIEWNMLDPKSIADIRLSGLARFLLDLRANFRNKEEVGRLTFEKQFIAKRLLADGLIAAAELGSLLWIAGQIINRQQPIGQFLFVQGLVARATGAAGQFISELATLDEDLANLYDYQEFMELPTRPRGGSRLTAAPEIISLEKVSFMYTGATRSVLHNISFTIKRGQHVAIVGENGAGKTTLIKLLTGLYRPSSGRIMLDDKNLTDVDVVSWHKQLSALQQDFQHYMFANAGDNVALGDVSRKATTPRISNALEQAEAAEFVGKLPRGLKTLLGNWLEDADGNKGVDLSGGQWQRLALARGFFRDAPIVILDEPTSAIDALAEGRIFERLFSRDNKKTVVSISHRLSTVSKADVIFVLKDGRLVERGTHQELAANDGEYRRIFGKQL